MSDIDSWAKDQFCRILIHEAMNWDDGSMERIKAAHRDLMGAAETVKTLEVML